MTPQETEFFGLHVVALDYAAELLASSDKKRTKEEWMKQLFLVSIAKSRKMTLEELQALVDEMTKCIPGNSA